MVSFVRLDEAPVAFRALTKDQKATAKTSASRLSLRLRAAARALRARRDSHASRMLGTPVSTVQVAEARLTTSPCIATRSRDLLLERHTERATMREAGTAPVRGGVDAAIGTTERCRGHTTGARSPIRTLRLSKPTSFFWPKLTHCGVRP